MGGKRWSPRARSKPHDWTVGGRLSDTYQGQKLYVVSLLNGDSGLHNRPSTFENGCTTEELLYYQLEFLKLHRSHLIESFRLGD